MAVPKYFEMYHSFLMALSDRKVHTLKDIKEQVIRDFQLTEEEMGQMLPSGRQAVWLNRLGWCRTYLKKAGLIESPKRAEFRITEEGERLFRSGEVIDDSVLERYPSFQEFKRREGEPVPSQTPVLTGKKKRQKGRMPPQRHHRRYWREFTQRLTASWQMNCSQQSVNRRLTSLKKWWSGF